MTLTNPEWYLKVENETKGWSYETFPGDLNPPYGDVWISADDFSLAWGFEGDTSPGPLEAPTFQLSLSCTTAADVPAADFGDLLRVTFKQPDGAVSRNPGTGVVTGDFGALLMPERAFWITDLSAVESADRMQLSMTATASIVDATLAVQAHLTAEGWGGDWESYAESLGSVYPIPAVTASILSGSQYAAPNTKARTVYLTNATMLGLVGPGVKVEETVGLMELLDSIHPLWTAPPGWDSRAHGAAFVWDIYNDNVMDGVSFRFVTSFPWDPEANAPHAAPFELTYVASVLAAELLSSHTPAADGSTLGIIDACLVRASPEWRKDAASSIGLAEYKGQLRAAGSPDTDTDFAWWGVAANGSGVRSVESSLYVRNTLNGALDYYNYGGLNAANNIFLAGELGAGNGWVPGTFDILPALMSDSAWAALGPLFWPTNDRQITLVLTGTDPDDDLALGTPMFMTVLGCTFTIDQGHLVITPRCRPFVPAAINGVTDGVTWSELDAAYPAATWAQAADSLTWSQISLTSV